MGNENNPLNSVNYSSYGQLLIPYNGQMAYMVWWKVTMNWTNNMFIPHNLKLKGNKYTILILNNYTTNIYIYI